MDLYRTIVDYINGRIANGSDLWPNVNVDTSNDNFKKTADGSYVWFDPLFYDARLEGMPIKPLTDIPNLNRKTESAT